MTPTRPKTKIPGDNAAKVMWKNGYVVGYTMTHVVWAFGFVSGSPQALAWNLATGKNPTWVLAQRNGKIDKTFCGQQSRLPKAFSSVLARWL